MAVWSGRNSGGGDHPLMRLSIRSDAREHAHNELIENEGQDVYEREVAEPLGDGTKISTRRRPRQRKADTSER